MDENQGKWAEVYGSLLDYILKLYSIERAEFCKKLEININLLNKWLSDKRFPPDKYPICEVLRKIIIDRATSIKKKQASDESLCKWLEGSNFRSDKYRICDPICEVIKKRISDQKDSILNKQNKLMDIIKKEYKYLYNDFVEINNGDICALLEFCHFKGESLKKKPPTETEYDISDIFEFVGLVVMAIYSDASTGGVVGTSESTPSEFNSLTAGNKTVPKNSAGSDAWTNIAEFEKWLSAQRENTAADAYLVNVNNLGGDTWTVGSLGKVLRANSTKYVSLDLSGSKITSIGERVFYECTSLVSITIPNKVASIDLGAFEDCTSLTSITIPKSVNSIGDRAFEGCTRLTSIELGASEDCTSLTSIGNWAFEGCTSLTSITIPKSVNSIGWGAFEGCINLISITFQGRNTVEHSFRDLRDQYHYGGIGTYTTTAPVGSSSMWTKQPN